MLRLAKGYRGRANSCFKIARNRVEKALARAYVGRKLKKRDQRKLWITKINASVKLQGLNYSRFVHGLDRANIQVDRKILAQLAETEPMSFRAVLLTVDTAINPELVPSKYYNFPAPPPPKVIPEA